ncbi:hypothetical protein GS605_18810 [Ruegeria sp. HKCCD7559]|nr:hypothetical protein [Ruegeria sp. HKCCD7559]
MLSGAIGTATGLDILTILLIAVGVGVGYLDYVLMPALAVFVLITIYALIRRAPNTNS